MSNTKFTSGEWIFSDYSIEDSTGKLIADCGFSDVLHDSKELANAHLIAAAPDMYAMIQSLSKELELAITKINVTAMSNVTEQTETQPDMWDMESLHDAQLLLKKARGE